MADDLDEIRKSLSCGCRVEIVDDEVHIFPCRPSHVAPWQESATEHACQLGMEVVVDAD